MFKDLVKFPIDLIDSTKRKFIMSRWKGYNNGVRISLV
jgi:hypothetical protein